LRSIDHRRHSLRDPGGVHLNETGRALARRVGAESGPFERVVTSPLPRAMETAQAMGAGAGETRTELGTLGRAVEAGLGPIVRWSDFAEAVRGSPAVRRFASVQRGLLLEIAGSLPEGGRALVVSHGGVVEIGAVVALPEAPHGAWGGPAGYCEGIRLFYEGGRFVGGTPIRVDRAP
jgi:broad specificity phosphatase PhoE